MYRAWIQGGCKINSCRYAQSVYVRRLVMMEGRSMPARVILTSAKCVSKNSRPAYLLVYPCATYMHYVPVSAVTPPYILLCKWWPSSSRRHSSIYFATSNPSRMVGTSLSYNQYGESSLLTSPSHFTIYSTTKTDTSL